MAHAAHHSLTDCQPSHPQAWRAGIGEAIAGTFRLWRERARERRTFSGFDHRELQDLGLSRWAVEQELAKPFWRG